MLSDDWEGDEGESGGERVVELSEMGRIERRRRKVKGKEATAHCEKQVGEEVKSTSMFAAKAFSPHQGHDVVLKLDVSGRRW